MNLYMPVYKKIEDEILSIANDIFFDDDQINVYSLSLGDILIRCSIEIEALSKEIYLQLGGNPNPVDANGTNRDLYFDTDCLQLIIDKWKIDKKKIQISNPNMYFSKDKSILTPLHKSNKRGSSGSLWKRSYQSLKHNRTQSIKKATIWNVLNCLGALYILNLYYENEKFLFDSDTKRKLEFRPRSMIFSPFVFDATKISMNTYMGDHSINSVTNQNLDEYIYFEKLSDDAFKNIHRVHCEMNFEYLKDLSHTSMFKDYLNSHAGNSFDWRDAVQFCNVDFIPTVGKLYRRKNISFHISQKELILNKQEPIYPILTYNEYLQSSEGLKAIRDFEQDVGIKAPCYDIVFPLSNRN